MSVNSIHGKNAVLYLGAAGAAVAAIADQVDYDITTTPSFADTTTIPNASGIVWQTQVKGPIGWAAKMSGKFNPTSHALWDLTVSESACDFYLYPSAGSPLNYYYGSAFVTMPTVIAGGVKAEMTNALNLSGNGTLSYH